MSSDDVRDAIYEHLGSLRSGSLTFWGSWFGKPHDNIHRIVGADSFDRCAVIYFDHAETLLIEAPRNWSLDGGRLLVREAERVCFQWFHYGRLPGRETLHFEAYRLTEGRVTFETDFQPFRSPELHANAPAVQLHSIA